MHLHVQAEWKTVWIPISQKPANLGLQYFLNRMYLDSAGQGVCSEKLASLNLSILRHETSSTINDLIFALLSLIIMTAFTASPDSKPDLQFEVSNGTQSKYIVFHKIANIFVNVSAITEFAFISKFLHYDNNVCDKITVCFEMRIGETRAEVGGTPSQIPVFGPITFTLGSRSHKM